MTKLIIDYVRSELFQQNLIETKIDDRTEKAHMLVLDYIIHCIYLRYFKEDMTFNTF